MNEPRVVAPEFHDSDRADQSLRPAQLVEIDPTDLASLLDISADKAAELIERGWTLLLAD